MNIIKKAIKEAKELNVALTECKTPKFREPTPPPNPNPNYKLPASVATPKMNCTYKTPCGWCTKWDKKCDNKPYKRGLRVKINPIDDYSGTTLTNKICESESDHEWECCGMSTAGISYRCRKCGTLKHEPIRPTLTDIHSITYAEARGDDDND